MRAAERDPDHEAVVFPDGRITYAELEGRALRIARSLLALGVQPGGRVGILMPNCMEFVELLFGISLIGGVMVPINARFAPRELGYVIENGDLEIVFTSDAVVEHADYVARLHEALPSLHLAGTAPALDLPEAPKLRQILLFGPRKVPGMRPIEDLDGLTASISEDAVWDRHRMTSVRGAALVMYTSGTTAMPKGCVLCHEALVRTAVTRRPHEVPDHAGRPLLGSPPDVPYERDPRH